MSENENDRRSFLKATAFAGSALILSACGAKATANDQNVSNADTGKKDEPAKDAKEVMAVEDLMREHGVLRRALFVFGEAAVVLPGNAPAVWADAIQKAAKLFR